MKNDTYIILKNQRTKNRKIWEIEMYNTQEKLKN